ncbi:hypothetical protein HH195_11905 (plasmid) [Sarcina sp. JB2]|jgi:hypothetical protein|uniref:Uncharacterized protein n=1 Tax=Candidatus Sarcina troglodytae TaxID=2726954 RepID=A0ACD1BGU3_9CLOT|nr:MULTISPECIES: hypothetical protein [Sarcina]QPJ86671.1 hypothetical protein HH195_11905 [Sarcina sp. JB2]
MKIRKCGEIRKSFVIETLVKKIDFINSELDNICSNITISENTNKKINLNDIKEQIREIQDFIDN